MLITDKIKIGVDVYTVIDDAEMIGSELGSIDQSCSIIRMRLLGYNNRKISERMYFKVLMHEIVHGFDFNVMFVGEDKVEDHETSEDAIDLVTQYIIKNLDLIIEHREGQFDDFSDYMHACESKMKRIALLFYAILDFIDDNKDLIDEFKEVFE